MNSTDNLLHRLKDLNEIGIALSRQRDTNSLLETILEAAKRITNADAGTLYLHEQEQQILRFEILRNDSLKTAMGGTSGAPISFYPVQLYDEDGNPNHAMVVSHSALSGETVNIPDAYMAKGYDFSGTKKFDAKTGYRSQSFLTVPMRNHENEIIGVLQLINAQDRESSAIVPFSTDDQQLLESLASQAAIALTNRHLINQLEELFEAFIQLINTAIDDNDRAGDRGRRERARPCRRSFVKCPSRGLSSARQAHKNPKRVPRPLSRAPPHGRLATDG